MQTVSYEIIEGVGNDYQVNSAHLTFHKKNSLSDKDRLNPKGSFMGENFIVDYSDTRQRICFPDFPDKVKAFLLSTKELVIVEISDKGLTPYQVLIR